MNTNFTNEKNKWYSSSYSKDGALTRFVYLIGLILNILFASLNLWYLYTYFGSPTVSEGYGYRFILLYLLVPVTLLSILFLILVWRYLKEKRSYSYILGVFIIYNLSSTFFFDHIIQSDVNKIKVIVTNLSSIQANDVEIFGRNKQHIEVGSIKPGESKQAWCDCRDVYIYEDDTLGILIRYKLQKKTIDHLLVGSNENLFDEYKEIRILNDSIAFERAEYGKEVFWSGIDLGYVLLPWDTITKRYSIPPGNK